MEPRHGRAPAEGGLSLSRALDGFDRRILACLQVQGDAGVAQLSEAVFLSPSQCSRRVHRLRAEGYITRMVALLDRDRLNLAITAYVLVTLRSHGAAERKAFAARVGGLDEVLECASLAGEADFLVKICTRDLRSYNSLLMHRLLAAPEVATVRTSVVLDAIKEATGLPLGFAT